MQIVLDHFFPGKVLSGSIPVLVYVSATFFFPFLILAMSLRHGEKQSYKNSVVVKAVFLGYCKLFPSGSASTTVFLVVRSVFHGQNQLNPCCARLISFSSFVQKMILITSQADVWLFFYVKILKQSKKPLLAVWTHEG